MLALATCKTLPEPDHDEALLLAALKKRGVKTRLLAWDGPNADPSGLSACVIRSTWNYIHALPAFLAWAQATAGATRLVNPLAVVRENCDKIYLKALRERGVPIVPTLFVERNTAVHLAPTGWDDVVVKPRVGAASFGTRRFRSKERAAAEAYIKETARERALLVQPYVHSVDGHGERALMWIDGELTHAIRKAPRFGGEDESVSPALPIEADERAFAEKILAPLKNQVLYARVDVARADDGSLLLMELELVEPSLYLKQSPDALNHFADALAKL